MKTGVIVYLVGGQEIPEPYDLKNQCEQAGVKADRVELVGNYQGYFTVEDAWHFLTSRGCGHVSLLVAQWEQQHLQPMRPPVRLCG
ncbi:hypothetical protein [Desulfobacca acetoxidans]|uniref:Uncharacterized protein n=1 Tax=Desulfobacca acetoxidans (strain ATCC 700848 / DSM 11109 / ASRB2) TaxID=880072 RepID=F2NG63_DESAR|nr:hypothetical protein [Desulfobacca acetoxidans]AEB08476.1 hypothetical protein Desac_0590 [Desulfobacca acetoxidans DSM 11109]HAY21744.1 hypothetical protein [Desulfobacterales bacterium]